MKWNLHDETKLHSIKQAGRLTAKESMTDGPLSDAHLLAINLCSNICQWFLDLRLPS